MPNELPNALEGLLFALLAAALLFLVSVVVRAAFGKRIGSLRSYGLVVVCAFVLHRGMLLVFPEQRPEPGEAPPPTTSARVLDPSLPPLDEELEDLPDNLYTGDAELSPDERAQLSEALSFLAFGSQLAADDPAQFDESNDRDHAARTLVRIYRDAQGSTQEESLGVRRARFTPGAYIDLAEQIKGLKPEWWTRYREAKASERASAR